MDLHIWRRRSLISPVLIMDQASLQTLRARGRDTRALARDPCRSQTATLDTMVASIDVRLLLASPNSLGTALSQGPGRPASSFIVETLPWTSAAEPLNAVQSWSTQPSPERPPFVTQAV